MATDTGWLTEIRPVLEALSFLSGPILAVLAAVGLKQLAISKATARISAKRDAYRLAAEQCVFYNHHVIPAINVLDTALEAPNVTFLAESEVTEKDGEYEVRLPTSKAAVHSIFPIVPELTEVLNKLESFAVFFAAGVADESVAYHSVGTTFCRSVRKYLPLMVATDRNEKHTGNVLKLFRIWNTRLRAEELQSSKQELDTQLGRLRTISIAPIGTEED